MNRKLIGTILSELPNEAQDRLSYLELINPRQMDLSMSKAELLRRTINHEVY